MIDYIFSFFLLDSINTSFLCRFRDSFYIFLSNVQVQIDVPHPYVCKMMTFLVGNGINCSLFKYSSGVK